MTSNPHPEHGPLWTTRRDNGTLAVHQYDPEVDWQSLVMSARGKQADAIEAQITPLPDGVYRQGDGFRLAAMFPVADGWTRVAVLEYRRDAMSLTTIVRRIPAEPPAPTTEDVPWWEALRDKRRIAGNHAGTGQRIVGCLRATNGWTLTTTGGHNEFVNDSSDGTVTVQAQGVES